MKAQIGNLLRSAWNECKQAGQGVDRLALDAVHSGARLGADLAGSDLADRLAPKLSDRLDAYFSSHMGVCFPRRLPVPALASYPALGAGQTRPVVPKGGFRLTDPSTPMSFGFAMNKAADATITLEASAPGTNWGKKGAECAVMSVYVDGKYQQDVVLWGGDRPTNYPLSLGHLGPGKHTVTLRYAKEKSPFGARGIVVSGGQATAVTYPDRGAAYAALYAPIVVGRHGSLENTHTDTPLGLLSHITHNADGTMDIAYTTVYSNEDTGDGGQPALEAALWGRLTDMETMFSVHVDARGNLVSAVYEDAGHVWRPFHGQMDGTHPIVRTLTDNNNVSDQSTGLLRFQLPVTNVDWNGPQEDVMRRNPQWFRVMAEELQREGKIASQGGGDKPLAGIAATAQSILVDLGFARRHTMADPRDYLYVQFDAQGAGPRAPIDVKVTLKNGTVWDSSQGVAGATIQRPGWVQTAIRLPAGTRPSDIRSVTFDPSGGASVSAVGRFFMYDRNDQPHDVSIPVTSQAARAAS